MSMERDLSGTRIIEEKWPYRAEFIWAGCGYVVGLGNVWRFPYLCGEYGGAAFIFAYLVILVFAGFPCFYMETAIGQYASLTTHILERRMCPIFSGVAYSMVWIAGFHCIYYNIVVAWSLHYFGVSFMSTLPWTGCHNQWNTFKCRAADCWNDTVVSLLGSPCYRKDAVNTTNMSSVPDNAILDTIIRRSPEADTNKTILQKVLALNGEGESPAYQYFNIKVLAKSSGIDEIGGIKWDLALCLFSTWLFTFMCLVKGIRSSGKILYITATFHYVILIILLARMVFLDGAGEGFQFYLSPNITQLTRADVWANAANQVFFSLSLGQGSLTTLAGYNHFHNNILRDCLVIVAGDTFTSILAGFVIFPMVGFLAKQTNRSVAHISAQGTGLAFVVYPEAITKLHVPQFWAIAFFLMLIVLSIDSMIVILQMLVNVVTYIKPSWRMWRKRVVVTGVICTVSCVSGLSMCTPEGAYVHTLFVKYTGSWALIIACLFEVCMVSYVYGISRFSCDIDDMIGKPKHWLGRMFKHGITICWVFITPTLLTATLIFNWINFDFDRTKQGDYIYPVEADIVGWTLTLLCIGWIPAFIVYEFVRNRYYNRDLTALMKPTDKWGPTDLDETISNGLPYRRRLSGRANSAFIETTRL